MAEIKDRMAEPVKKQTALYDLTQLLASVPDPQPEFDSRQIYNSNQFSNKSRQNSIDNILDANDNPLSKYKSVKNRVTNTAGRNAVIRTNSMETTLSEHAARLKEKFKHQLQASKSDFNKSSDQKRSELIRNLSKQSQNSKCSSKYGNNSHHLLNSRYSLNDNLNYSHNKLKGGFLVI